MGAPCEAEQEGEVCAEVKAAPACQIVGLNRGGGGQKSEFPLCT